MLNFSLYFIQSGAVPFLFNPHRMVLMGVIEMYMPKADLLERKRKLKWTNREIGNLLNCAPGVASSKLNGFLILKDEEDRLLRDAFEKEEQARAAKKEETAVTPTTGAV